VVEIIDGGLKTAQNRVEINSAWSLLISKQRGEWGLILPYKTMYWAMASSLRSRFTIDLLGYYSSALALSLDRCDEQRSGLRLELRSLGLYCSPRANYDV